MGQQLLFGSLKSVNNKAFWNNFTRVCDVAAERGPLICLQMLFIFSLSDNSFKRTNGSNLNYQKSLFHNNKKTVNLSQITTITNTRRGKMRNNTLL